MTAVSGGAVPGLAPQVRDHIRALLRAGKTAASVKACAVAAVRPDDLVVKELLFDAYRATI